MYLNGIDIWILWYSKICWSPVKNSDAITNLGLCRVIYIVFGFSLGKL